MTSCLVYLPHSYAGRGPAESCVRITEHFASVGLKPKLFVNCVKHEIPSSLPTVAALNGMFGQLPYRFTSELATRRLAQLYRNNLDSAPEGSIAYFWPNAPIELVEYAKERKMVCVREMINSPLANAKPILDDAYSKVGLALSHGITEAMVAQENAELALYDYLFVSNAEVEKALRNLGLVGHRILSTSFGWVGSRFKGLKPVQRTEKPETIRAVFVGLLNVRKGVPVLLNAWEKAGVNGELLLAGAPEDCLQPLIEKHCANGRVHMLGHVHDVAELYKSCDLFVFPTLEEGGPQVTYEAAACGLPTITTDMGAARLIEDGKTGLIVEAGNVDALALALRQMAEDSQMRERLGAAAQERVNAFEYTNVGQSRARQLLACS